MSEHASDKIIENELKKRAMDKKDTGCVLYSGMSKEKMRDILVSAQKNAKKSSKIKK